MYLDTNPTVSRTYFFLNKRLNKMVLFFNVINNKISYARLLKNINLILTKYLDLFVSISALVCL